MKILIFFPVCFFYCFFLIQILQCWWRRSFGWKAICYLTPPFKPKEGKWTNTLKIWGFTPARLEEENVTAFSPGGSYNCSFISAGLFWTSAATVCVTTTIYQRHSLKRTRVIFLCDDKKRFVKHTWRVFTLRLSHFLYGRVHKCWSDVLPLLFMSKWLISNVKKRWIYNLWVNL